MSDVLPFREGKIEADMASLKNSGFLDLPTSTQ